MHTVRANDVTQIIPLAHRLAGQPLTNSIAVIPFVDNRSAGLMRLDNPPEGQDLSSWASSVLGYLCRIKADFVVVISYTDGEADAMLPALASVSERAHECGVVVANAIVVASDGFADALDYAGELRPLSEIPAVDLTDLPSVPSIAEQARLPEPTPELVSALEGEPYPEDIVLGVIASSGIGAITHPTGLAGYRFVQSALRSPLLRDSLLGAWARGEVSGQNLLVKQVEFITDGTSVNEADASFLWGEGPRPDAAALEQAIEAVRTIAAVDKSQGVMGVLGWLNWALGRSTLALAYLDMATGDDPGASFVQIVRSMIDAGHLPAWAFEQPA